MMNPNNNNSKDCFSGIRCATHVTVGGFACVALSLVGLWLFATMPYLSIPRPYPAGVQNYSLSHLAGICLLCTCAAPGVYMLQAGLGTLLTVCGDRIAGKAAAAVAVTATATATAEGSATAMSTTGASVNATAAAAGNDPGGSWALNNNSNTNNSTWSEDRRVQVDEEEESEQGLGGATVVAVTDPSSDSFPATRTSNLGEAQYHQEQDQQQQQQEQRNVLRPDPFSFPLSGKDSTSGGAHSRSADAPATPAVVSVGDALSTTPRRDDGVQVQGDRKSSGSSGGGDGGGHVMMHNPNCAPLADPAAAVGATIIAVTDSGDDSTVWFAAEVFAQERRRLWVVFALYGVAAGGFIVIPSVLLFAWGRDPFLLCGIAFCVNTAKFPTSLTNIRGEAMLATVPYMACAWLWPMAVLMFARLYGECRRHAWLALGNFEKAATATSVEAVNMPAATATTPEQASSSSNPPPSPYFSASTATAPPVSLPPPPSLRPRAPLSTLARTLLVVCALAALAGFAFESFYLLSWSHFRAADTARSAAAPNTTAEYPWAVFKTKSVRVSQHLYLKLFPGNLFYFSFLALTVLTTAAAAQFPVVGRFFGRCLFPRRAPGWSVGWIVAMAGMALMLSLFSFYWLHDHNYKGMYKPPASTTAAVAVAATAAPAAVGQGEGSKVMSAVGTLLPLVTNATTTTTVGSDGKPIPWNANYMYTSEILGRFFGQLATMLLALLMFPTSRHSLLHRALGTNWDRLLWLHRVLGYIMLAATAAHVIAFVVNFYSEGTLKRNMTSLPTRVGRKGVQSDFTIIPITYATALLFVCMGLLSLNVVRRACFELFHYAHLLAVYTMLPMLLWHCACGWQYLLPPLALWAVDRLSRLRHAGRPARVVSARVLAAGSVVELVFEVAWAAAPGHYVLLQVPQLSLLEWHPFTLCEPSPVPAPCGSQKSHSVAAAAKTSSTAAAAVAADAAPPSCPFSLFSSASASASVCPHMSSKSHHRHRSPLLSGDGFNVGTPQHHYHYSHHHHQQQQQQQQQQQPPPHGRSAAPKYQYRLIIGVMGGENTWTSRLARLVASGEGPTHIAVEGPCGEAEEAAVPTTAMTTTTTATRGEDFSGYAAIDGQHHVGGMMDSDSSNRSVTPNKKSLHYRPAGSGFLSARAVCLVTGGIGVTPALAVLSALATAARAERGVGGNYLTPFCRASLSSYPYQRRHDSPSLPQQQQQQQQAQRRRVHLVWCSRSTALVAELLPEILYLLSEIAAAPAAEEEEEEGMIHRVGLNGSTHTNNNNNNNNNNNRAAATVVVDTSTLPRAEEEEEVLPHAPGSVHHYQRQQPCNHNHNHHHSRSRSRNRNHVSLSIYLTRDACDDAAARAALQPTIDAAFRELNGIHTESGDYNNKNHNIINNIKSRVRVTVRGGRRPDVLQEELIRATGEAETEEEDDSSENDCGNENGQQHHEDTTTTVNSNNNNNNNSNNANAANNDTAENTINVFAASPVSPPPTPRLHSHSLHGGSEGRLVMVCGPQTLVAATAAAAAALKLNVHNHEFLW